MAHNNSLYYRSVLEENVSLLPSQMDGNLEEHLLSNLKNKVENRPFTKGFIIRVIRKLEISNGIIDKSNFTGTAVIPVKFECYICSPLKDMEIICSYENIVKGFILTSNGPVKMTILYNQIDTNKFSITKDSENDDQLIYNKTKEKVEIGTYVRVAIISVADNPSKKQISSIGKLLDIATNDEKKAFEDEQRYVYNNSSVDTTEFI